MCVCVPTGGVGCEEAPRADAAVGAQLDVQLVAGGADAAGELTAAQLGQLWTTGAVTVIYLDTHTHRR